jgi:hypothetical protein
MYLVRNNRNGKRASALVQIGRDGKRRPQSLHLCLTLKAAKDLCKLRNSRETGKPWKPEPVTDIW